MYAVIVVETQEALRHFESGREAAEYSKTLTEKTRIIKIDDDAWRARDRAKLASGERTAPIWASEPWAQEEPIASHYASVSQDGTRVAYTSADPVRRAAGRRSVLPAKEYLTRFANIFPEIIEEWAVKFEDSLARFEATTDADTIEQVYTHGPESCMCHRANRYDSAEHPVRVYGDSDLVLAYLIRGQIEDICATDDDEYNDSRDSAYFDRAAVNKGAAILARALIRPENKTYVRIYSHRAAPQWSDKLAAILRAKGYRKADGFEGATIQRIDHHRDGYVVMPYLDGTNTFVVENNSITITADGSNEANSTNGIADWSDPDPEPEYCCNCCGDGVSEDDVRFLNDGDTALCRRCYRHRTDTCGHCGERFMNDELHTVHNREVCTTCREYHYNQCENCQEWHEPEQMFRLIGANVSDNCAYLCSDCADDDPDLVPVYNSRIITRADFVADVQAAIDGGHPDQLHFDRIYRRTPDWIRRFHEGAFGPIAEGV